jgi:hypothetical protein
MLRLAALAFLATGLHCLAWTQIITPVPKNFVLDGKLDEWDKQAPTLFTRGGSFWLARNDSGLIIAGTSPNENPIFWAASPGELATKGRLELRLSVAEPPELAPANWDCKAGAKITGAGYDACIDWLREQDEYHEKLRDLFERMWRIAPGVDVQEAKATEAFDTLSNAQKTRFLRPSGIPIVKFEARTFEILIPWSAFPPADRLQLEKVRLALNSTLGDQVRSLWTSEIPTGGSSRQSPEKEGTLLSFPVSPAIASRITPCEQPLVARDLQGNDLAAFYFLTDSLEVNQTFYFQDPVWRYNPFLPDKDTVSPYAATFGFFSQKLPTGEILCGPFLAVEKGTSIRRSPFELGPARAMRSLTPTTMFPTILLPDGTRLVRYSDIWQVTLPGASCATDCPVANFQIFALSPTGDVDRVLDLGSNLGLSPFDVESSADWRRIIEYHQAPEGGWTSNTYCLVGHRYQECGTNSQASAPAHQITAPN